MNITKEQTNELELTVSLEVEKADYEQQVKQELRKIRQNASIKGFRKGKVPQGMIQKMYGKSVLADEVMKKVQTELFAYIEKENLNFLAEPIPSKKHEMKFDFENDENFSFHFDLGLRPEININYAELEVPYYTIEPTAELIDKQIEQKRKSMGENKKVEMVEDEEDTIKAYYYKPNEEVLSLEEIERRKKLAEEKNKTNSEESEADETATENEETTPETEDANTEIPQVTLFSLRNLKGHDELLEKIKVMEVGDTVTFNPAEVIENKTELKYMLNFSADASEEEIQETANQDYTFQISEILHFEPAELNSEFYQKIYPAENEADKIETYDDFVAKIREEVQLQLENESNQMFHLQMIDELKEKAMPALPDNFLKNWLLLKENEKEQKSEKTLLTEENIEEEYDKLREMFAWDITKDAIEHEFEIEATDKEILMEGVKSTFSMFQQYGQQIEPMQVYQMVNEEIQKNPETKRQYEKEVIEDKIPDLLKDKIKLDEKTVSFEEFEAIVEQYYKSKQPAVEEPAQQETAENTETSETETVENTETSETETVENTNTTETTETTDNSTTQQ